MATAVGPPWLERRVVTGPLSALGGLVGQGMLGLAGGLTTQLLSLARSEWARREAQWQTSQLVKAVGGGIGAPVETPRPAPRFDLIRLPRDPIDRWSGAHRRRWA